MSATPSGPAGIDMGGCVSYGIETFKKDVGFHILAAVVIWLVNSLTSGLLGGPLMLGYFRALKKIDAGQKAEIGDVFSGFDVFLPAFLAYLLGGLVVGVASLLCIVPAFLVMAWPFAAILLIQRGETDGIAALKRSWPSLQANLMAAAVASLVLALIAVAGALLCGVGMLATAPIAMAGFYRLAQQLLGSDEKAA